MTQLPTGQTNWMTPFAAKNTSSRVIQFAAPVGAPLTVYFWDVSKAANVVVITGNTILGQTAYMVDITKGDWYSLQIDNGGPPIEVEFNPAVWGMSPHPTNPPLHD